MWEASAQEIRVWGEEEISFPLSQPEPASRLQNSTSSSSVQRRRRSAACCCAPYVAIDQSQKLNGGASEVAGLRRQSTRPFIAESPLGASLEPPWEENVPTAEETERVARELSEAAITSAGAFAADAKSLDPSYATKPTAFLYRGHSAQIATSTAGMYGEMIESFIKQVVAYAKQYGADEFSVFCDLGSGRGAPSAIAAYEHEWLACLDLISRFELKGAEIKHQISSSMWISSEGRTAYVYVKTDWKERQKLHRQWLREKILGHLMQQQGKLRPLLHHVRIQQQLVLQQLQREDENLATSQTTAAAACTESPQRTPRSCKRRSCSPVATPRSSSRRQSAAADLLRQKQQDMVLFHLAARRQQLQVLNQLEPEESFWGLPRQKQQSDNELDEKSDRELLDQLRAFRSTHLRLSKWHQPLTIQSLLLVSLLPFEGQNQWLQLQQQLLQPASRVLTRAQRLLLLGYDETQRKEEELCRDKWLEQLAAAAGPQDTMALRSNVHLRLTHQRQEDMSLFAFLPPDSHSCAPLGNSVAFPDGASLRLGFRHSLKELQEKQSPIRSPRGRSTSCTPMASRNASPLGNSLLPRDPAGVTASPGQQQLSRQQRRSPVRPSASRRTSSRSVTPISSRRRVSVVTAAAALAAADAAAAASPMKAEGRVLGGVGTPNTRRAVQRVEKELKGLAFSNVQTHWDLATTAVSHNVS